MEGRRSVRHTLAFVILLTALTLVAPTLHAQENTDRPSTCQAVAQNPLPILKASVTNSQKPIEKFDVKITYVSHSTFRIENAAGLKIATDFAGFAGHNIIPDVVTMNHAHSTHFTIAPDPRIPHVLRGWGKNGNPAKHNLLVGEALIRNVTTDINSQWAGYEPNGNSIFIFEMDGLCIGHLGHLHHQLTDAHYAQIGRLDVLMIPVDGGYTLSVEGMTEIAKRLRASLILPMHWFGSFSLERFLAEARTAFPVQDQRQTSVTVSLNSLPVQPTVVVLRPESSFGLYDGD
ncbi:MAG: MBL fold metallo-hydrolase [Pseudomonadota bacterium]